MSEASPTPHKGSRRALPGFTAMLACSAAVRVGYWASRGLGERDTEAMESPLMLSVARQLTEGPRVLYGPFGRSNPLVLIHAQLYYRASALVAWPMTRAGVDPVAAARVAGRSISAACLSAAMAAAYRLGRLGGLPRRAGRWSALLFTASPMLAGQPFAVRPDMAGVALQTWGVVLALESPAGPRRRLGIASVLFGLAVCAKQHLVVGWAVSAGLAGWGWIRGREGLGTVARLLVPGLAVASLAYAVEWLVTGGRVWEAAFVAAASVGRVHPGDWNRAVLLSLGVASRSAGVVALLAAVAFILAARRPGPSRWLAMGAAMIVIGAVLAAEWADLRFGSGWTGAWTYLSLGLAALAALPAGLMSARSPTPMRGVDAALSAYLVAELALMVVLFRSSAGAWHNYAIPATVFASALAARGLSRALDVAGASLLAFPAILACVVLLVSVLSGVSQAREEERIIHGLADSLAAYLRRPRSAYFFIGRPGLNRADGRLDLVYDDWLYPVFELIGLAESRSLWLRQALASGTVTVIVNNSGRPVIEGTAIDLRRLGCRPDAKMEPYFFVWIR